MKVKIMIATIMSIITLSCDPVNAQDKVYLSTLESWWSNVYTLNTNPSTGAYSGDFTYVANLSQTAAIGYGTYNGIGYIVSLQYTENEHVDIYARKADGTGSNVKIMNNADIASGDLDLDYVRLGIDQNGVGYIVSKASNSNTIYIGTFTWNGSLTNPTVNVNKRGVLNTNDNTNSIFINGDLAVAGSTLFILANNGLGSTKIYTVGISGILSGQSNSTHTITSKWDLRKADGSAFSGSVNGFAFASTGSAYLSTSGGLYFINQNSTNFNGVGTVKCSLIKTGDYISDLATSYVPISTTLPVKIHSVKVSLYRKD